VVRQFRCDNLEVNILKDVNLAVDVVTKHLIFVRPQSGGSTCHRAVVRSCGHAVMQSCSRVVVRSCGDVVMGRKRKIPGSNQWR
jgi:hypothetical protein